MSSSGIPSDGWLWHKYYGKTPAVPFTISLSIINIILFYKEGSMLSKIFLTAIFTLSVLLTGCGKGKRSQEKAGGSERLPAKKALSVTRQDLKSQFGDMIWDRCGNDELTKVQRP